MQKLVKYSGRFTRQFKGPVKLPQSKIALQAQYTCFKSLFKTPKFNFSSPVQHEFKAETKKLLDIVAKSMYTDQEVFLRELLSNASDALEKQRYANLTNDDGIPLEIDIVLNENDKTIVISDSGVGMTKETLIENLGTIAKSGSQDFREEMSKNSADAGQNIIGQFGIGFYSAFIVGDRVSVISKRDGKAFKWVSDGTGTYEISEEENVDFERGTQITIDLRSDCLDFCKTDNVKSIIQKYSNFITYPIAINGEQQNLVKAIWSRSRTEVKEAEYKQFWEHLSKSKMDYQLKIHYQADVPLDLKALIYIPSSHNEQYGLSQESHDIHLYSRKVLIKQNCRELLPQYLRFVKGVVDCEDLPLNISRENYQDSALMSRLQKIVTTKILKELASYAKRNPEEYITWYKDFQNFLKEGLAMDQNQSKNLIPLIRYEANYTDSMVTLDEYIENVVPEQKKIYYLLSPTKENAMNSPYLEPFRGSNIPVIILNIHIDEMIFRQLDNHKSFQFVNVESDFEIVSNDLKQLVKKEEKETKEGSADKLKETIPEEELTPFCLWAKNELSPVVSKVQISDRLRDSPALIVSNISSGMRQMMMMMQDKGQQMGMQDNQNLTLEINPKHPLINKLNKVRKYDSITANTVAKQLLDNCLVQSGIQTDQQQYMSRINQLMGLALDGTLEKVGMNEFVQQNYDGTQAQRDTIQGEVETEIVLDENGKPKVVERK